MRGRWRTRSELLAFGLTAVLTLPLTAARANAGDEPALDGDAFVGASVFLFERTVLIPFAPSGTTDSMLDAGVIVLAHENAGDEDGAVALDAILGWLAAAAPAGNAGPISADRQHALICLAFGADPAQGPLARHAGLTEADRAGCTARYAEAHKRWAAWIEPFRRSGDATATLRASPEGAPSEGETVLHLSFAPAIDEGDQAIADAMKKNGLFQVLTDDLNAMLAMPRPITALLTQCGEPRAFYNPDRGEAVLCYELLAALLKSGA